MNSKLSLATLVVVGLTFAQSTQAAPRPQNVLSPDAALKRLVDGNARYAAGTTKRQSFSAERAALALGQNPFAAVLGCADSRVAPEFAFDTARGDLFICRVAGNFAEPSSIASLEFAVAVLKTPLILVLGHSSCGAVDSTIKAVNDGAKFPGHIPTLVKAISPAVKKANKEKGNLLENSTAENVRLNVEKLKGASPILKEAVKDGSLKIVGGIYHLDTGKVVLLD